MADTQEGYGYQYENVGLPRTDTEEGYGYQYENVGRTSPDTEEGYAYQYENVLQGFVVSGIPSGEAFGVPIVRWMVELSGGIPSEEAFGVPAVLQQVVSGGTSLSSGGSIHVFGYPVIIVPKVGEPPRKTQVRRGVSVPIVTS